MLRLYDIGHAALQPLNAPDCNGRHSKTARLMISGGVVSALHGLRSTQTYFTCCRPKGKQHPMAVNLVFTWWPVHLVRRSRDGVSRRSTSACSASQGSSRAAGAPSERPPSCPKRIPCVQHCLAVVIFTCQTEDFSSQRLRWSSSERAA